MPKLSILTHASLGRRLALGFGALLLLMGLLAAFAMLTLREQGARIRQIVEVNQAKSAQSHALLDHIATLAIQARSVTLLTDVKEIDTEMVQFRRALKALQDTQQALQRLSEQHPTLPQEATLLQAMLKTGEVARPLVEQAAKEGEAGSNVEATLTLTERVRPAEQKWRQAVGAYIDALAENDRQSAEATLAAQTRAIGLIAASLALALVLGVAVAWQLTRSISAPVARAVRVAERIAEGDLGTVIGPQGNDEVGRLLQAVGRMQERLRDLVGSIRDAAESIHTASSEVASGNQDLSQRTEQTASHLQQAASSMTQLNATVRQSAQSARQAEDMAGTAADVARRGGEVVTAVVSTMAEIHSSSRRIGDIIGVIDGIAFQTNILALNAAVEAARAGEQGRGFAVVAGEVRTLASRSAEAAREIKALIGTSVDKVEAGSRLVEQAGQTMQEIVDSVARVSTIVHEISGAAAEQSNGLEVVNQSVHELDQMTQQNAALVEQSAAAAESLKGQSARMTELVSVFHGAGAD